MFRAILKIWPALTPIALYLLWYFLFKRKKNKSNVIDGEYEILGDKAANKDENAFSLANKNFAIVVYLTFVLIIASLVFLAFKKEPVKYPIDIKTIEEK